jgi:hypothetical protein
MGKTCAALAFQAIMAHWIREKEYVDVEKVRMGVYQKPEQVLSTTGRDAG